MNGKKFDNFRESYKRMYFGEYFKKIRGFGRASSFEKSKYNTNCFEYDFSEIILGLIRNYILKKEEERRDCDVFGQYIDCETLGYAEIAKLFYQNFKEFKRYQKKYSNAKQEEIGKLCEKIFSNKKLMNKCKDLYLQYLEDFNIKVTNKQKKEIDEKMNRIYRLGSFFETRNIRNK